MGFLNLSEGEWGEMRLGTFFLKLEYYFKARLEEKRLIAELIRLQTFHLINIQLSIDKKIKDPESLWSYDWEKTKCVDIVSKNDVEVQEKIGRMIEMLNKVGNGAVKP